jgi:hypothetical protein
VQVLGEKIDAIKPFFNNLKPGFRLRDGSWQTLGMAFQKQLDSVTRKVLIDAGTVSGRWHFRRISGA